MMRSKISERMVLTSTPTSLTIAPKLWMQMKMTTMGKVRRVALLAEAHLVRREDHEAAKEMMATREEREAAAAEVEEVAVEAAVAEVATRETTTTVVDTKVDTNNTSLARPTMKSSTMRDKKRLTLLSEIPNKLHPKRKTRSFNKCSQRRKNGHRFETVANCVKNTFITCCLIDE